MAHGKKLEDIIGQYNVTQGMVSHDSLDGCTGWMTETSSTSTKAHILNFGLLGSSYRVSELKGYGFDSICATCNRHYCLIFTKGTAVNTYEDGDDKYLEIGVDISISNGEDFVEYIYNKIFPPKLLSILEISFYFFKRCQIISIILSMSPSIPLTEKQKICQYHKIKNEYYSGKNSSQTLFRLCPHTVHLYLRSSIPIFSSPFRILSITVVISFSSKVWSAARNEIEYATDLYPSSI